MTCGFWNAVWGSLEGGEVGQVIFDPSACYARDEYELGIMKMFGGFGDAFFGGCRRLVSQDRACG